ncbi:MAG: ribosome biogenesis GTPase Der [Desulfobulbaceae bacterium A2]|nr:MAG: ribosome biogenesis GTPase Der [Desulfobulbaceae bacterium A2]
MVPAAPLPLVALIGRPNVGKSTIFNRMTRSRQAIVDPTPGVTRDRHYADIIWEGRRGMLVDTGGLEDTAGDSMGDHIRHQALAALEEADVALFVLDGREGVLPGDGDIADLLRRAGKPTFVLVNKIDSAAQENELLSQFYALGFERLWPLSAEHGHGFNDLMQSLGHHLLPVEEAEAKPGEVRLAVLGRPNAGKSSLINQILGEERMVVSEQAGTTRDAVNTLVERGDHRYVFIDTAGIRRKGKTRDKLEKFSIIKALAALSRCDIALVLVDAAAGITEQDTTILGYVQDHGRACIILLNKWDLVARDRDLSRRRLEEIERAVPFMAFAPVLKVSALTGQGIKRLFPLIGTLTRQYHARVGAGVLNRVLREAVEQHPPGLFHGRHLKFYFASQLSSSPPTFALVTNAPDGVHFSYQRYLINRFREALGLAQVPLRLVFRPRSGRKSEG